VLTGETPNRWLPILLGIGSPLWLYMSFTWFRKHSPFNAACLFAIGILAAIIAIQSFARSNKSATAWLVTAWGGIYTIHTWSRAIHESLVTNEGQRDHAGSLILLGTLILILLIVSVYLIRWCFLKVKARVGADD